MMLFDVAHLARCVLPDGIAEAEGCHVVLLLPVGNAACIG